MIYWSVLESLTENRKPLLSDTLAGCSSLLKTSQTYLYEIKGLVVMTFMVARLFLDFVDITSFNAIECNSHEVMLFPVMYTT
jgi:hypothetical protein